MMALVAATEREALPLIEALGATQVAAEPFDTWRISGDKAGEIVLVVSGVGKVAAAAATAALLSQHPVDRLINLGACGALVEREDLRPGALCQATRAVEGDRLGMGDLPADPVRCHPLDAAGLIAADLVTVDRPVFDAQRRRTLSALGQLVDMEGAAVARTAAWFGVPCTLVKGISDLAGTGDRSRLLARLDDLAAALARLLVGLLAD